jgi:hypothetical protein
MAYIYIYIYIYAEIFCLPCGNRCENMRRVTGDLYIYINCTHDATPYS